MEVCETLSEAFPLTSVRGDPVKLQPYTWKEIRLFLSSTFIDTHGERDALIKNVIPNVNRKLAPKYIRIIPVDLRWGVLKDESKDCYSIQKTCLNQLEKCRQEVDESCLDIEESRQDIYESPWFLGLRTERYGWVQNELADDKEFDDPQRYTWIETIRKCNNLSITSLECIGATLPPKVMRPAPTVFFYKRDITFKKDVEEDMHWIFDFEYVPENAELKEEVSLQYNRNNESENYKKDKDSLDKYLENSKTVKYSSYKCTYQKGDAVYTFKSQGKKSFGFGRVSGLEEFEEQVEKDLLHAIEENFKEEENAVDLPKHKMENIQHENVIKMKAKCFVGRYDLLNKIQKYCIGNNECKNIVDNKDVSGNNFDSESQKNESNVMIVHGEPGCGKSALIAAVSKKCMEKIKRNEDFIFVHAVDSCTGSNNLAVMLSRLHMNLREYCKEVVIDYGLDNFDLKSTLDIKRLHIKALEEFATKCPNKRFIVIIDAVNQLYESLQARTMWWLPSKDAPCNLRVVISTLNEENRTFEYASKRCPNAELVPVEEMSYKDRTKLVSGILKRYNKKLTTENDPFLGNQMESLLAKSKSPLYLVSATESLRRFGVYEKVSGYIKEFPSGTTPEQSDISKLFDFLLAQWSTEYGERFVEDVTGFLCLSKDGLLENELNDILMFIEESQSDFSYECSFSRFYDTLSSFLAAGGGGYLRFFHDQLKYQVERKFLTPEVKQRLHKWLIRFYLKCLNPLLCESPSDNPPVYYKDCLKQVVHHQLQLTTINEETVEDFTSTLRNLYFVRERVKAEQGELLQHEYIEAIQVCKDDDKKALKDWGRFFSHYRPHIEGSPQWIYNMAANQQAKSSVNVDTINTYPEPEVGKQHALYWCNKPSTEDESIVVRYTTERSAMKSEGCTASTRDKNRCCIGGFYEAFLYETDTGVLIHHSVLAEDAGSVKSVYISEKFNTFWVGDTRGCITVWSVETGMELWKDIISEYEFTVIFIANVGDYVACGTGGSGDMIGTIVLVDEETGKTIKFWSTQSKCFCYCFHGKKMMMFSGHCGLVRCWSVEGALVKTLELGNEYSVLSLCASPTENHVAMVLKVLYNTNFFIKQVDFSSGEEVYSTIKYTIGDGPVLYDASGGTILCTGEDRKTVLLYSVDGQLLNKIKGHSDWIMNMCLVPGTNDVLTVARNGSSLLNIPSVPDQTTNRCDEAVQWCGFVLGGAQFATLSGSTTVQLWDTYSPNEPINAWNIGADGGAAVGTAAGGAAVHPDGSCIIVYTRKSLFLLSLPELETISRWDGDINIYDICISPNGSKCVNSSFNGKAFVFEISTAHQLKKCDDVMYKMTTSRQDGYLATIYSCDVHTDNVRVVSGGGDGVEVWNILTGEAISKICDERIVSVKFLNNQDKIFYVTNFGKARIMDINGRQLTSFDDSPCKEPTFLKQETQVITNNDKSIRVHDMSTGEVLYTFVEHRSELFGCLAVHPDNNMVIATNVNGMFYILRKSKSI